MTHSLGSYEAQFRNVIAAKCQALEVDLLLVYGGAFGRLSAGGTAQNGIFDLIRADSVDGVLLLTTTLSSYCGAEKIGELVDKFRGIPCCSIGVALESVPSVVIDNRASMEAIVEHLIVAHGRKRLAFLGGTPENPEAQARYTAYCEVLLRHGLHADPKLFAYGYFWSRKAREGMEEILAHNVDFDALVCANDSMAQSVVGMLRERGLRVPVDVSVTGFDDVLGSRLMKPPLTTAAQPFEDIAERCLQILMDQFDGRAVPLLTELNADLVIRQSCGCGRQTSPSRSQESRALETQALQHLREQRRDIQYRLHAEICTVPGCEIDGADRVQRALEAELEGRTGAFIECVETVADAASQNPECHTELQRAIACLRQQLRPFACVSLEDLWHQARDTIELAITRGQVQYRVQLDDNYLRLLECSEDVSRALNRESFRTSLARTLPLMRIHNGAISKFVDDDREQLELMVGLIDQSLQEDTGARFPAHQLIPPGNYPDSSRHTSLVLPLILENKHLGVAVFEYNGDAMGQLMVRTQISAALGTVLLHQEMIEKSMQHERSVQERIATTKRMEALSLLAGGVAHDLNNALGPLVALPDVILDDLELALSGGAAPELRRDVEAVKSAALRASQTIKDLLTLGRQGRTAKELVDLSQVITYCANSDLLRMALGAPSQVHVRLELPEESCIIHASEPHIVRAITNLVHNAAEAISGVGEVVVKTYAVRLDTPLQGFETIESGDYVVVTVSDNGKGMAVQEMHRIFEPFFTKKRTNEHTGSGLGLAIVHGVVKEHDGFIDVASEPGVRTTFSLYFPRADVQIQTASQDAAPVARGHGRILIVDDEPVQLRTGRRVLGRLGYQVDTLESGRQAHERFLEAAATGESPYDLVILDMILNEERDGLERFEQIRQLFPSQRAIVVSGHAPTERAEAAFQRGLAWLSKPYTADAMAKAVLAALNERPSATMKVSCRTSALPPAGK